jgi:hypothetical protein
MSRLERLKTKLDRATPSQARKLERQIARIDRPVAVEPPKKWAVSAYFLELPLEKGKPAAYRMKEIEHRGKLVTVKDSLRKVVVAEDAEQAWLAFLELYPDQFFERVGVTEAAKKPLTN